MKTTRWHPDTCKCIVEYQYDETLAEPTFTGSQIVRACEFHQASTPQEFYELLLEENQLKNLAREVVVKETKKEDFNYYYDENRKLVVDLKDLTQEQKDKINSEMTKTFGDEVETKP